MPGQVLKLPTSKEMSHSTQPKFYKVKTGDTFQLSLESLILRSYF